MMRFSVPEMGWGENGTEIRKTSHGMARFLKKKLVLFFVSLEKTRILSFAVFFYKNKEIEVFLFFRKTVHFQSLHLYILFIFEFKYLIYSKIIVFNSLI